MRLFVAVWPSDEVVDAIAALDRPAVPGVRWTTPDQWHVTLRFLGDIDDALVDGLAASLPAGPAAEVAMGPATAGLGSVLVAPVLGLDELVKEVVAATASIVAVTDARRFRGHLTLARASRGASVPLSLVGMPLSGTWPVRRVALVRSRRGRYTEVAGRELGEGP